MPVNLRSHVRGQGFLDLHFVTLESIERLDIQQGPYSVRSSAPAFGLHRARPGRDVPERPGRVRGRGREPHEHQVAQLRVLLCLVCTGRGVWCGGRRLPLHAGEPTRREVLGSDDLLDAAPSNAKAQRRGGIPHGALQRVARNPVAARPAGFESSARLALSGRTSRCAAARARPGRAAWRPPRPAGRSRSSTP